MANMVVPAGLCKADLVEIAGCCVTYLLVVSPSRSWMMGVVLQVVRFGCHPLYMSFIWAAMFYLCT